MKHAFGARSRGLTLLEMMVVVTVASILLAVAAPSFQAQERNARLKAATNQLLHEVFWSQNASIKMNRPVRLRIRTDPNGWCYGITDAPNCDCTEPASCNIDGQEKVTRSTDHPGVALITNIPNALLTFEPKRGTVNAGTVQFSTQAGHTLNMVVTGFGTLRARVCVPVASTARGLAPNC